MLLQVPVFEYLDYYLSMLIWIVAIVLFFGGAFALRATWPRVQDAWGAALAGAREQPA